MQVSVFPRHYSIISLYCFQLAIQNKRSTFEMTQASLRLSTKGLGGIKWTDNLTDFIFLVNDSQYRCPRLIADHLSPAVCALHHSDDTLRSFEVEMSGESKYFSEFMSLGRGDAVVITVESGDPFRSIARCLGNVEFLELLLS
jgi:hypothetical protein